jgi:hypothetical protein
MQMKRFEEWVHGGVNFLVENQLCITRANSKGTPGSAQPYYTCNVSSTSVFATEPWKPNIRFESYHVIGRDFQKSVRDFCPQHQSKLRAIHTPSTKLDRKAQACHNQQDIAQPQV